MPPHRPENLTPEICITEAGALNPNPQPSAQEKGGINLQEFGPVILASGGSGFGA